MADRTVVITGTDTGVGKTALAVLLARFLRMSDVRVAAVKPLSSGSRSDARALRQALGGGRPLDEINPWHFHAPLAPLLAARREGRRVRLAEVLAHLRVVRAGCDVLLVEGAGGLLTPLGEDFDVRDIITAMRALPIIVAPNRLGTVNQVLLVMAALPRAARKRAQVVLMSAGRPNLAGLTNPVLLAELIGRDRIHQLPWLKRLPSPTDRRLDSAVRRTLRRLIQRADA